MTYTIGGNGVLDKSDPYRPRYDADTIEGAYSVRTFSDRKKTCRFSVINDMHSKIGRYSNLVKQIDTLQTDFIFLNGDIAQAGHYTLDSLVKYEVGPLGRHSASIPIFFARGNHEGRGNGIINVSTVFQNDGRTPAADPELPFTYMFRAGPAAVIVFDSGETGARNSMGFCGKPLYEDYLKKQMEWAQEAFKSPQWRGAKVRICILHAPMVDPGVPDDYVVHTWMNHNFCPILNKAGVDLMIGADLHEYQFHSAGSMGNGFPIIVNDNYSRLETCVDGKDFIVTIFNEDGTSKCVYSTK